jgi:hypothetical protein
MAMLDIGDDHYVKGLAYNADVFSGTVYTDVVNMKNFHQVSFLVVVELGSTGTSTITVQACDDVVPTNRSAIPFYVQKYTGADDVPTAPAAVAATGFTTTAAAAAQMYRVMVDGAQLGASGYGYVQMKAVEVVNDPVAGSVLIILDQARNKDNVPASAIV